MGADMINFELVSPERKLVSEPVKMAVIPGAEGEMGVGAGHASFVVALKAGVVKLYQGADKETPREIFIAGGFADVTGDRCVVLAEEAVNVNDLDQVALTKKLAELNEDLGLAVEVMDKTKIQKSIELVKAKIFAVTKSYTTL